MLEVILSGLYASVSSILGKISLTTKTPLIDFFRYHCEISVFLLTEANCWHISYVLRFSLFILMFYCNALTFTYFLKSLETRSSLSVTVISSAVNFLVTGLLSGIILGEKINNRWYLGAGIIAIGVSLIAFSQSNVKRTE